MNRYVIKLFFPCYTYVDWKIPMISADDSWPMRSKHCNINGRNLWMAKGNMLKMKLHLVTLHENVWVSLWTFQLTHTHISVFEQGLEYADCIHLQKSMIPSKNGCFKCMILNYIWCWISSSGDWGEGEIPLHCH